MALMEIAKEFRDNNPKCMVLLEEYFDSFEEIFQITPEVVRYKCMHESVPGADYRISAVFSEVEGLVKLVEIVIQE